MVAVVPSPPLMIPQLTVGRAAESAPMREAALAAAAALAESAGRWFVIGGHPGPAGDLGDRAGAGSFLGYGVDVPVALTPSPVAPADPDLPLPLLIAGWLRGEVARATVTATAALVTEELPTPRCRTAGAELAARADAAGEPVGLLVVGDGATTHTEKAPGYLDRRAGPFDDAVAAALADADPAGLLALDAGLAAELGAVGRAPWQVLAGAAEAAGGRWRGELTYSAAPFGVGYHVALWHR
ncbi:MAG TPA: hypothetical protein VGH99_08585 [Pseudonocardia sp.]|jgi:hypothetical protein